MKHLVNKVLVLLLLALCTGTAVEAKTPKTSRKTTTAKTTTAKVGLEAWLTTEMNSPAATMTFDFASIRFSYANKCVKMNLVFKSEEVVGLLTGQNKSHMDYVFKTTVCKIIDASPYSIEDYVAGKIKFDWVVADGNGEMIQGGTLLPRQYYQAYYELKKSGKLGSNVVADRDFFENMAKSENSACPKDIGDGMTLFKVALEGPRLTYFYHVNEDAAQALSVYNAVDMEEYKNALAVELKEEFDNYASSISKQISVTNRLLERMKASGITICYRYFNKLTGEKVVSLEFTADELMNAKRIVRSTEGTSEFNQHGLSFTHSNAFVPGEVEETQMEEGLNWYTVQFDTDNPLLGDWIRVDWMDAPLEEIPGVLDTLNEEHYSEYKEEFQKAGLSMGDVEKTDSPVRTYYGFAGRTLKAKMSLSTAEATMYITSFSTSDKTILVTTVFDSGDNDSSVTENAYKEILKTLK